MVTFPDQIHPMHGLVIRFKDGSSASKYLEFFKITTLSPLIKFIPQDITFDSAEEMRQFLYHKGIVQDEIEVSGIFPKLSNVGTIVNTKLIYEPDESNFKKFLKYKYYSVNEVAEMLSLSRPTVYKLVNDQALKSIRIYDQLRINHVDLMAFINKEDQP
jgi:excisionase family DNA binding protein